MFKLRALPYPKKSFVDFLSATTLDFHYGKHHQSYINNLNNLIKGGEFENMPLYDIIKKSSGAIFNNAAQVYNHDFYWDCITPNASAMSAELESALESSFGGVSAFKEQFLTAATTLFGSGWCWLVLNDNKLEILQTSNATTPIIEDKIPLLVVDVWEHAYYIDYKNARPAYLERYFYYIHWEFVSKAYQWALKEGVDSVRFYINEIHKQ